MTRDEALAWLAQVFDEAPENVRADTPRDELGGWDSFGVLTLMADLDDKFEIRVSEEEMRVMTSVQDILDLLRAKGKLTD